MKKTEFEFNLLSPIEYHAGGRAASAQALRVKAPTFKSSSYVAPIKQAILISAKAQANAMSEEERAKLMTQYNDAQKKAKEETPSETTAAEKHEAEVQYSISLLAGCSDVSLDTVLKAFAKLLSEGTAFIDDESKTPLTMDLINRFSYEDVERLLGEYIVYFLT